MKRELEEFFKDRQIDSLEDMNASMNEFVMKKCLDFAHQELSPEHKKAHEYLEGIEKMNEKQALKKAQKAMDEFPDCLKAKMFFMSDKELFSYIKELEEMLDNEEKRLVKTCFMKKYKKGLAFTLEGEDYLKGIEKLIHAYISIHGYFKASQLAEKVLLLDKTDTLGMRFILAGLYACLEEEGKLMKLYRTRKEEFMPYLVSFMCLYYKRGEFEKAKEYLELVNKKNPCFIPYIEANKEKKVSGKVKLGGEEEVAMIMDEMSYLFDSAPHIKEFIAKKGKVY